MSNFGTNVVVWVADVDMLQDLYVTKNHLFDKTGEMAQATQRLFGNSFLFSKADEAWKAKRKATAHAFYKDKLVCMLDALKDKVADKCEEWMTQIRVKKDRSTEIDIA